MISSLHNLVATWFGYVGACVAGAEATCRPFLAFVALAAVSLTALVFLIKTYRAVRLGGTREQAEREALLRERQMREHVRRTLQANTVRGSGGRRGWQVPA